MTYVFPSGTMEGAIERAYEPAFKRLGGDPREDFLQCFERIKDEPVIPPNYGDLLLELANDDPELRANIQNLRRHGVRDEDIRSWYNTHILERSCILYLLEIIIPARWCELTQTGDLDPDDATIELYKEFPRYGDPDQTDWGGVVRDRLTDEDRPLPFEVYHAVDEFVGRHLGEPSFQSRLRNATSLNAVIREEIRRGTL